MKDYLNILIYATSIILAVVTLAKRFAKAKSKNKILLVGLLSLIVAFATYFKENITERDALAEKQIEKIEQSKRDSLTEAKNEKDKLNIIEVFTNGFARYELKIDNLLPLISDIKIKSAPDGLILNYQLNKRIDKLILTLGPNPFDETFDDSFGGGVLELPKKIAKTLTKLNLTT